MSQPNEAVRQVLQKFQDGYTARDVTRLDEFMELFAPDDDIELIGIGAGARGEREWFQGRNAIREIIESDWRYWGDVVIDVPAAQITVRGEVAWLSVTAGLLKSAEFDAALNVYLEQMKGILDNANLPVENRLVEAIYFGADRIRDIKKAVGHRWPLVITGVLVKVDGNWRFHTLHWAMPVD